MTEVPVVDISLEEAIKHLHDNGFHHFLTEYDYPKGTCETCKKIRAVIDKYEFVLDPKW